MRLLLFVLSLICAVLQTVLSLPLKFEDNSGGASFSSLNDGTIADVLDKIDESPPPAELQPLARKSPVVPTFGRILLMHQVPHRRPRNLSLQRIARAPQTSALLAPYPRVGKRAESNQIDQEDGQIASPLISNDEEIENIRKRMLIARVGKRAFMYVARVG